MLLSIPFYQRTINTQILLGKNKVWNLALGLNGINGDGSFNSSQNETSWSDLPTRFIGVGSPSLNRVNGITGQYPYHDIYDIYNDHHTMDVHHVNPTSLF